MYRVTRPLASTTAKPLKMTQSQTPGGSGNGVLEDWCVFGEVGIRVCRFVPPPAMNPSKGAPGGLLNGVLLDWGVIGKVGEYEEVACL